MPSTTNRPAAPIVDDAATNPDATAVVKSPANDGNLAPADDGTTATLDPNEPIVVNRNRPDIKVARSQVVELDFTIDGMTYHAPDDQDNPDAPGTFGWNTIENVPGTVSDSTNTSFSIVDNVHSFPLSEWATWPTLRRDILFSFAMELMRKIAKTDANKFNSEFQHAFDGVKVHAIFIKVPAGTAFTNPWSTQAVPTTNVYTRPYVFGFIKSFKLDIKDARHRRLIKNIYDGMPVFDREKMVRVPRIEPIADDPYTFALLTLKNGGYIDATDKELDMLVKTLSFTR